MAGTLRLRFVQKFNYSFTFEMFCREHLQEVISLLSNEPKNSSLPLNENKEEEEQQDEQTFPDTVKFENLFFHLIDYLSKELFE